VSDIRDLLDRPAPEVAVRLLGWTLRHVSPAGAVSVQLTEVEAYDGEVDPASHAFRGRTPRNAVMFGPPGRLYVYRSYGIHWCANVVCAAEGQASAVLLRAGRVVEGIDLARQRRGGHIRDDRGLARGPACLTQAMGIDSGCNGVDLLAPEAALQLRPGETPPAVSSGPRVGISVATDLAWRHWVAGDATVSAYKRSPRAGPPVLNPEPGRTAPEAR